MVKGVNRRIVEINTPEAGMFERALLFVRPGTDSSDPQALTREAARYVRLITGEPALFSTDLNKTHSNVQSPRHSKKRKSSRPLWKRLVADGFLMGIGAGIFALLQLLF